MAENVGDVDIILGGTKFTLRHTLRAGKTIDRLGGFSRVFELLAGFNFSAYVTVIAAGTGENGPKIEALLFETGLPSLVDPLSEYVSRLANGGRLLTEGQGTGEE